MSTDVKNAKTAGLTILLPAGRMPLDLLNKVNEIAQKCRLELYCSTAQNLRLMGIKEDDLPEIKKELSAAGADFKTPGKFPLPRICIGSRDCKMGKGDTERLSWLIREHFKECANVKPKFKIAISGCILSCSGTKLTDIGVMATPKGYDLYVGGKGGPTPKVGRRIARDADEKKVLSIIEKLVDFHDAKTGKKQRMSKLLDHPEFPFPEV